MAILKYIPPTKKIIDKRSLEGGYYEAECEVCGGEFYPERSNAKYCTPNCGLIAHRTAIADGTVVKKAKKSVTPAKKSEIQVSKKDTTLCGKKAVVDFLRSKNVQVRGLVSKLKLVELNESMDWLKYSITRISTSRYTVVR